MAARRSPDFVIIGRTDAYGAEGLDAALKRAEQFLRLGADGIFVAGLKTPEDYVRVGKAFKGAWNCAAIFEAAATPWLTPAELHDMGFSQVAYPNILIGRVAKAIENRPASPRAIGCRQGRCLQERRAGNGTEEPGRCPRFAKVERAGKEIPIALAAWWSRRSIASKRVFTVAANSDQQERHRHDQVDVVQADRVHQQIAKPALGGEHLAEHGADQRQREADADAR